MRKELRFLADALALLADHTEEETEATIHDISRSGISIESEHFLGITPNSVYDITVIPKEKTNVNKFRLKIESRWVKLSKSKMKSGFSILVSSEGDEFLNYLEYLKKNSATKASSCDQPSVNNIELSLPE